MSIRIFHVDVFVRPIPFSGNPAAVVISEDECLSLGAMQRIAAYLAQPETAFLQLKRRENSEHPEIFVRWFTPLAEVNPGGNSTVAAGHVLLRELGWTGPLTLRTEYGAFDSVCAIDDLDRLIVHLPAVMPRPVNLSYQILQCFGGLRPLDVREGHRDFIAVFDSEAEVRAIEPSMEAMSKLSQWTAFIATAPGDYASFVYRTFAPVVGLRECPGSASALMNLVPYWKAKLGNGAWSWMSAEQLSLRGGEVRCRLVDDNVVLAAEARTVSDSIYDFHLEGQDLVDCNCTDTPIRTSWI